MFSYNGGWLKRAFGGACRLNGATVKLTCVPLEDRAVPTTFTVNALTDSAPTTGAAAAALPATCGTASPMPRTATPSTLAA
jgi:hypothetical protein